MFKYFYDDLSLICFEPFGNPIRLSIHHLAFRFDFGSAVGLIVYKYILASLNH